MEKVTCYECNGTGKTVGSDTLQCPVCLGAGFLTSPSVIADEIEVLQQEEAQITSEITE